MWHNCPFTHTINGHWTECTQPDHCVGWWFLPCTSQRPFHRGNKAGAMKEMQGLASLDISETERTRMFWVSIKLQWSRTSRIISSMKSLVLTTGHWELKCKNVPSHLPCSCACHLPGFSKTETESRTAVLQGTQSRKEYYAPILCMEHYFHCTGFSCCFSPNTTLGEKPIQRMHVDPSLTRILGQWVKLTLVLLGQALTQGSWQFWLLYQFFYSIHKPLLLMLAISISEHLML